MLEPQVLSLHDDSHAHAGHPGAAGGGGHVSAVVVSERFSGLPVVRRHRLVYDALHDLMGSAIHALALRTHTPQEYRDAAGAGAGTS